MCKLWNQEIEKKFFIESRSFASLDSLFYTTDKGDYIAYWPKHYKGKKNTLQSRNSLIGNFTEKWATDIINLFAKKNNLYSIQKVICYEIGLPNNSPADVALSKKKGKIQKPEDIVALFEVKMSIVWNWKLVLKDNKEKLECIGDYTTHQGNPGLLRSDSMLKAIGKSINIRVSSDKSSHIPIVILGNTPITKNYYQKVDNLKKAGIIQGFWSLNPYTNNKEDIKNTKGSGFKRVDTYNEFEKSLSELLKEERNFFSSMKTKKEIGKIIEIANKEKSYKKKGEKFINLLRDN